MLPTLDLHTPEVMCRQGIDRPRKDDVASDIDLGIAELSASKISLSGLVDGFSVLEDGPRCLMWLSAKRGTGKRDLIGNLRTRPLDGSRSEGNHE